MSLALINSNNFFLFVMVKNIWKALNFSFSFDKKMLAHASVVFLYSLEIFFREIPLDEKYRKTRT